MKKKQELPSLALSVAQYWIYNVNVQYFPKVQAYLEKHEKSLLAALQQEQSLQAKLDLLQRCIGGNLHPGLKSPSKDETDQYGESYLCFNSVLIDPLTMRLLSLLLATQKNVVLRLCNNYLSKPNVACLAEGLRDMAVKHLVIQWNDVDQLLPTLNYLLGSSLEVLYLRSCKLRLQNFKQLNLKEVQANLRVLDLHDNKLGEQFIPELVILLRRLKKLEFLGLGHNNLSSPECLASVLYQIGDVELKAEQLARQKELQILYDQTLDYNRRRKKGMPERPLPFLEQVLVIEDYGRRCKNLGMLAWGGNGLRDDSLSAIELFLGRVPKVQLYLGGNSFQRGQAEALRRRFCDRVLL